MKEQINEIKRMQQLAGIINENLVNENLKNIESELENAGFEFEDGILGGVGSGGGGYYDFISDKISGINLDKFNEKEFNKWYDNFSIDDFNSFTYEKEYAEENEDGIDYDAVGEIQPGIYAVGEDDNGFAKIEDNGNVTLYASPTLSDDGGEEFKIVFSLNTDGSIEQKISKEEVKNLLQQNTQNPGTWGLI